MFQLYNPRILNLTMVAKLQSMLMASELLAIQQSLVTKQEFALCKLTEMSVKTYREITEYLKNLKFIKIYLS